MKKHYGFGRIFGRINGHLCSALLLIGMFASLDGVMKAQTDTGRVTGTVTDSSGAVVSGASVTLTDTDTGTTLTRTTGGDGNFTFPALMRGHYDILTTACGFASQKQDFELQVQQVDTLEIKLNAGAAATTVDVTDTAPL